MITEDRVGNAWVDPLVDPQQELVDLADSDMALLNLCSTIKMFIEKALYFSIVLNATKDTIGGRVAGPTVLQFWNISQSLCGSFLALPSANLGRGGIG